MLDLLDKGYTPEYISLLKWLELRRQVMKSGLVDREDIGALTCAMCKEYNTFENNCDDCTMIIHFVNCNLEKSIWKQINSIVLAEFPVPLHLITQMVNQLQYLVAEYGKYRTKP